MNNFLPRKSTLAAYITLALFANTSQANCGSAVCLLNTDWDAQGLPSAPGLRFDARFESVRQDKLREGSKVVGLDAVTDDIVPLKTLDNNLVFSFDYPVNMQWAISALLPLVQRTHTQLTRNEDGSETLDEIKLNGLGDLRIAARYALFHNADVKAGGQATGLSFGVKLPTGKHNILAPSGELAEPGLQPGTGTTDAFLGAYYNQQSIESGWGYFARAQYQAALNTKDDYKPGNKLAFDAGLRYSVNDALVLQLQANALQSSKASGARAEPANTGGTLVTLSPGASFFVTKDVKLYAFYQRPIYQNVNGVQLSTTDSFALGISARF